MIPIYVMYLFVVLYWVVFMVQPPNIAVLWDSPSFRHFIRTFWMIFE